MSDWWTIQYAKMRQQDIQQEIDSIRLRREARRAQRKKTEKSANAALYKVGAWFISWGTSLQKRYGEKVDFSNAGSHGCSAEPS